MATAMPTDRILLLLIVLLVTTLALFFAGLVPYPFGLLILVLLIVARKLQRSGSSREHGVEQSGQTQ